MAVETRGVLFEYGLTIPPLALVFNFNPQEISRSRTVTIKTGNAPGSRGGYDFLTPTHERNSGVFCCHRDWSFPARLT